MRKWRLLVGTTNGLYEFGSRKRDHLNTHEVTALPDDGRCRWALVDRKAVWRSMDRGRWEECAALRDHVGTCLAVTPSGLWVGTAGAHLFRLEKGRLVQVEEFERVKGRKGWYTPWGDPPDTRSVSADSRGTLYVNVHVGGVVRSTDGGRSWQPTLDIDADVHQVLTHPVRPRLVLAAAAIGLGISEDSGNSWRFETEGFHARYSRAVAVAADHLLVSASTGPGGKRAAIYRRRLGQNAKFEKCRQGLPDWFHSNIDTFCLAASGMRVAFGTEDGRLFLSTDAGSGWELIAEGLPTVQCVSLA